MKDLGCVHIITGNGKGKTTSSFGLAMRAIGAGYRVAIVQFLKGQQYSELKMLRAMPHLTFKRFGLKSFIVKKPKSDDYALAKKGYEYAKKIIMSGDYDLVVLDEIFLTNFFGLLTVEHVAELITIKPKHVELVLTGRKADKRLFKLADYVSEIKEIKHPFQKGILARRGIEN